MRNLDIAQLRAVLAIHEYGGVGKAAQMLNLTQSAVSMQVKRLEETVDAKLFERQGRKLALTPSGELMRNYARKMIALNDEIYSSLQNNAPNETISIGTPSDIIEPLSTHVLPEFRKRFGDVKIQLVAKLSRELLDDFEQGKIDLIVTTEYQGTGQELTRRKLNWYIAKDGQAHKIRPLPIATCGNCAYANPMVKALDEANFDYELLPGISSETVSLTMAKADLAVKAEFEGSKDVEDLVIANDPSLPKLPDIGIYLYKNEARPSLALNELARIAIKGYQSAFGRSK